MCPMCNIKLHSDCAVYTEIRFVYIKQTPARINKKEQKKQQEERK